MDLFIYDNSPLAQEIILKDSDIWTVNYTHDRLNPGVSKAYNEGAKFALTLKKKWILILDQDTRFPLTLFNEFSNAICLYPNSKLFAPILKSRDIIVSPTIYRFNRGFSPKSIVPGIHDLRKFSPINSGMFINLNLFFNADGYDENIKLDFSDFVFIRRLCKIISEFVVLNVTCSHDLSSSDLQPLASAEFRYKSYCEGAKLSARNLKERIILLVVCLIRGARLGLRYKSFTFLTLFGKCYLRDLV
ncbi:hypothetical protein HQN86_16580 [Pedobacter panaciterrae]|uniref:hypothetical protein n=1 Tax=Pedobacter panaciterrae TaxID=363849 RepID=UPI00155D9FA0|nr:hypothetical protein [Pedobacter panaciterrae]NQX55240.1 hypothetical protein [Pedobacter panaciterrae]